MTSWQTSALDKLSRSHGGRYADRKVYLVGAGPGNPDLVTVKAARLLGAADIIIHDRLAGKVAHFYGGPQSQIVQMGKAKGQLSVRQDDINRMMIDHACAGKMVVRLKGGDPLIFSRGGEELAFLKRAGIAAEIVPGVTSAAAAAASLGVPMTHRDYSHTVSFLTGHGVNGAPDIDWNRFADDRQTLALYMARSNAAETTHNLISSGLSPHTPVAAVADAGGVQEQIERGVLHELPILVERLPSDLPTVIMIGRVLQEVDSWQDSTSLDQPIRAVA